MSKRKNLYVLTAKDDLDKVIKGAKHNHQLFYIGVAKESGQNALDAVRNRDKSGHHADRGVKKSYGFALSRVHYTRLIKESTVCDLEKKLIAKYEDDPFCQNKKQGQDDCITGERGIVYVRTYSPEISTAVRSPKKLGTTKGTSKGTRKRSK